MLEFCGAKTAAARQSNRIEPKLRPVRVTFRMNVWRFVAIS